MISKNTNQLTGKEQKWRPTRGQLALASSALALVASYLSLFFLTKREKMDTPKELSLYFPFVFSETVDPRHVFTVGDQVLAEHLFAFNARLSAKTGFESFASEVSFMPETSEVAVKPFFQLKRADGTNLDFTHFCNGLESSLRGTQHAPYGSIMEQMRCLPNENRVVIRFSRIPVNMRFLFTLPDLAIFDPADLPLTATNGARATGPYSLTKLTREHAILSRNKFYPQNLVSNSIDQVDIHRYSASDAPRMIQEMTPRTHHAVYFFGYSIDRNDLNTLRQKGYDVTVSPTEWFVYLSLKKSVPPEARALFASVIKRFKSTEGFRSSFGDSATSITPKDREYSLSEAELNAIHPESTPKVQTNTHLKISTLESWASIPFFAKALAFLKNEIPQLEVELLPPEKIGLLFSNETPIALCPLGISPTDPLTHFSFLAENLAGFKEIVSQEQIAAAAITEDSMEFNGKIKEFERRTIESGLLLPIAHFPGVVARRADLSVNETQSFGWGIQAWSLRSQKD
jgi:hypothetical protein